MRDVRRDVVTATQDEFAGYLQQCGPCDAGLPMSCTCAPGDTRVVILSLARRLDAVIALHAQVSAVGLADGAWCPADGEETPCPTLRAALGDAS